MFSKFNKFLKGLAFFFLACQFQPSFAIDDVLTSLMNNPCAIDMRNYYPKLLTTELSEKQLKRFFDCAEDAVEIFKDHVTHRQDIDYFPKIEVEQAFILFNTNASEEENRAIVDKIFSFKKLLLGGDPEKFKDTEVVYMYKLLKYYYQFLIYIRPDIEFYRSVFLNPTFSKNIDAEFEFRVKDAYWRLQSAFELLQSAYQKVGFEYTLKDLNDLYKHLEIIGFLDKENVPEWKRISLLLHEWAEGIFGEGAVIKGQAWKVFLNSVLQVVFQAIHVKLFVADRDLSLNKTKNEILKGFLFFLNSINIDYKKFNQSGYLGFPAEKLDNIIRVLLNMMAVQTKNSGKQQWFEFLVNSDDSIPLVTRALSCFVFRPVTKGCRVESSSRILSDKPVIKYYFPDGNFLIYPDKQEWKPNRKMSKEMVFTREQIGYFQKWISYVSRGLYIANSNDDNISIAYQDRPDILKSWFQGFFTEDDLGRIHFGSQRSLERMINLRTSFPIYDSGTRLLMHAYEDSETSGIFDSTSKPISREEWEQIINEMAPVLMSVYAKKYSADLESNLIKLFDYGDNLVNSSNSNSMLEYGEVIDIIFHLRSAFASSELTYDIISKKCKSEVVSQKCAIQNILNQSRALSNFPLFSSYIKSNQRKKISVLLKKILPKEIKSSEDLISLFLLVQTVETKFYFMDANKDHRINVQEVTPFLEAMAPHVLEYVPFISNQAQAYGFLTYSITHQSIPFLSPRKNKLFDSVKFTNWLLYPDKAIDKEISRLDMLEFAVNIYSLSNSY